MRVYEYLILGGGMVAGYAAKELVARGLPREQLAIVSEDAVLPYERPPLSKGFLAGKKQVADVLINAMEFYRDHGIDVLLNTEVTGVEPNGKRLATQALGEIGYHRLIIATGARVRTLDVPGAGLGGVLYLRSLNDSARIRAQALDARQVRAGTARAVVIGAGFIGMEVAAVLTQMGLDTALVFPGERVWKAFFTAEMSAAFERYYQARGVRLVPNARVTGFGGKERVEEVLLQDGQRLPADLVVAGIGVLPVTEVLQGSGIALDNGVLVNEYLETDVAQVYAAGDAANYQDVLFGRRRRVEHWDNAVEQGRYLARRLTGERAPFIHVPYFFSDVFDLSYELWGDNAGADRVVYRGDLDGMRFSAWWLQQGRLIAAFVLNRPDAERELAPQWIKARRELSAEALADESQALVPALTPP